MAEATRSSGISWLAEDSVRDLLVGPNGLRLDEWLTTKQARIVKQGPHRIVYRVDLPNLSFYIKHNLISDTRSRLRQIVRPSKARMEYDRALAVAARGIPTYAPLAVGEQTSAESFLVTETLEDAVPLNVFLERDFPALPAGRRTRLRQALAQALGRLIARLHHAGILHADLHCGNFLLRLDGEDQPALFLIDLQDVRLGRRLGWAARRKNLAMLNRWFFSRTSRADRLRFWKSYVQINLPPLGRGGQGGAESENVPPLLNGGSCFCAEDAKKVEEIEEESARSNAQFWRRRERRCMQANRYFWRIIAHGLTGHAVREIDAASLDSLLTNPDAPFEAANAMILKDSPSTTVAELDLSIDGRPRRVIYKRFRVTSWTDPFANLVRPSPALRSWRNGHRMLDRSLPTARPLAVFRRRACGIEREGYLVTEKIPDAIDLASYVKGFENRQLLRARIDQLARLLREMHRRCLVHRDLKASNILVRRSVHESPFVLIDLVGMTRHSCVNVSNRARDLARLNVSFLAQPLVTRSDRLRFLRVYLQWGFFGRHTWKAWWRRIEALTLVKVQRNVRTGRPLA